MLSARRLVQPAGNRHSTCVNQHAAEVLLQSQVTAPGSKHWCRVMRVVARLWLVSLSPQLHAGLQILGLPGEAAPVGHFVVLQFSFEPVPWC